MNFNFYRMLSLKVRVTLSTLTILLICVWILAFYSSNVLYERIESISGNHQLSTASLIAAQVTDDLSGMIRGLEKVADEFRTDKQVGRRARLNK